MFDEHYLYFLKDVDVVQGNKELRKIGNKFNIKLLSNAIVEVKINYLNSPNRKMMRIIESK